MDLEAVKSALSASQALQDQIGIELSRLAKRKKQNRLLAAEISGAILARERPPQNLLPAVVGDPTRPRNELFFYHNTRKSKPKDNVDTIRRRKLEADTFLERNQPAFDKHESKALVNLIKQTLEQQTSQELDFDEVAKFHNEAFWKRKPIRRTPLECNLHYRAVQAELPDNKRERTKDQVRKLAELVHVAQGEPSWPEIAQKMEDWTPWECITQYHKIKVKLAGSIDKTWTLEEDKLLQAYFTAMGPQIVISGQEINHLAMRCFPNKSQQAVYNRATYSLVNPTIKQSGWSSSEERRLALLMKAYQGDFNKVGAHFPHRASKSVRTKWNRTLTPEYSSKPFSKEEKERLAQVVRENPSMSWVDIARTFFRDRHPQRLQDRWGESASTEDLKARMKHNDFIRSKQTFKRGGDAMALDVDDVVIEMVEE